MIGPSAVGRAPLGAEAVIPGGPPDHRFRWAWGPVIVLYAAALVVLGGHDSLWGDEGFTARMVALPWHSMVADLARIDVNMALYYAADKVVASVVGHGEAGLRAVSALAVAAALPLMARLGRRLFGDGSGLTAAVLFALNPFTVVLAATARPYALLLFGTVATSLSVLTAVTRGRRRDWLVWSVSCALLLYVHLLAVLVIAAQAAFAGYRCLRGPVPGTSVPGISVPGAPARGVAVRATVRAAWPAVVVLAVAVVPTWLFIAPPDTLNWVGSPSVSTAWTVVGTALGSASLAVLLIVAAVVGAVRAHRRSAPGAALAVCLLVVPAVAVVALLPVQSLLVGEYLSVFLVPVCLLAGCGIGALPGPARPTVVLVLLLLELSTITARLATGSLGVVEDWRGADHVLTAVLRPGDAVGFPNSFYRPVAEYYALQHRGSGLTTARPVLPEAAWGSLRPYQLDRLKRLGLQAGSAAVAAQAGGATSVWLVGPDDALMDHAVATLTASGDRIVATVRPAGVVLVHLVR